MVAGVNGLCAWDACCACRARFSASKSRSTPCCGRSCPRGRVRPGLPRRARTCARSARAAHACPRTRAALPSSLRGERIDSPCHSSPEQYGGRGMANDEYTGRVVAGEGGRAHLRCHSPKQGPRSHFGRRPIAQLDAVRRSCAALLIRPTCGTHPARARFDSCRRTRKI